MALRKASGAETVSCSVHTNTRAVARRSTPWCFTLASALLLTPALSFAASDIRVDANTNPVQVYVDAWTADNLPVVGLDASAFVLAEDGSTQAVTNLASPENHAVSVVFLMDYSYSMRKSGALPAMQAAVKEALAKLGPDDRAAIIKFSGSQDNVVIDFTDDFAALAAEADKDPGVEWGSRVYDNLEAALNLFANAQLPQSSHSIVLVSDGLDKFSTTPLSELLADLDSEGVSVFTIGIGDEVQGDVLEVISSASSGRHVHATDGQAVEQLYRDVVSGLKNEYVLSYNSAISVSDCTPHIATVTVQLPDGSTQNYSTEFSRCVSQQDLAIASNPGDVAVDETGGAGAYGLLPLALLSLLSAFRRARAAG
jgi:hypothetical protein